MPRRNKDIMDDVHALERKMKLLVGEMSDTISDLKDTLTPPDHHRTMVPTDVVRDALVWWLHANGWQHTVVAWACQGNKTPGFQDDEGYVHNVKDCVVEVGS